jgi:putative transposase
VVPLGKAALAMRAVSAGISLMGSELRLMPNYALWTQIRQFADSISYLPTTKGWLYLAVTLDLFSRKVIGWSMSDSLESKLVLDALEMARNSRTPSAGLLHHSDRGVQYAALDFQRALARLEAVQSMSRKGDCWDNAVVESLFCFAQMRVGS